MRKAGKAFLALIVVLTILLMPLNTFASESVPGFTSSSENSVEISSTNSSMESDRLDPHDGTNSEETDPRANADLRNAEADIEEWAGNSVSSGQEISESGKDASSANHNDMKEDASNQITSEDSAESTDHQGRAALGSSKSPKTGWYTENGKRYFAKSDGTLYYNQIITFGSAAYYMGSDGSVQTGVFTGADGVVYAATTADGRLNKQPGWEEANGKRYFNKGNGTCYTNLLIRFGSAIAYYMGADGSVQTGVFTGSDGVVYAATTADGRLKKQAGWEEANGKRYFNKGDGTCYTNKLIRFGSSTAYYMGADGSVKTGIFTGADGVVYAATTADGRLNKQAGWEEANGKRYFNKGDGTCYKNQLIGFGGTCYYMGSDGSMQKNAIVISNGSRYYVDTNGQVAKNQWVNYNGKKYFAGATGAFYHNQFISFGDIYYYLNTDGSVVKTQFKINGVTLTPNPSTGAISKSEYLRYIKSGNIYNGYSTYVLIDINSQSMKFVRDGIVVLTSPVITGKKGKFDTPKGSYSLLSKATNVRLKGEIDNEEWDVVVNYWMPFIGSSIGMHDAGWKSQFGGNVYTYNGSHGCVNLPPSAAKQLFNAIAIGTKIFIV